MECGTGILLEILPWMLRPEAHIGIGSQMEHKISATHGLEYAICIKRITTDQTEARRLLCLCQKLGLSSREVIVTHYLMAVLQQAIHEVIANKSPHTL